MQYRAMLRWTPQMHRWVRHLCLTVASLAAAVSAGFRLDLSKSDWASWVQAVGSIAAICAAIWISQNEARRVRRLDYERRNDRTGAWAALLFVIADDAAIVRAIQTDHQPDYILPLEDLKASAEAFRRIQIELADDAHLVKELTKARRDVDRLLQHVGPERLRFLQLTSFNEDFGRSILALHKVAERIEQLAKRGGRR